MVKALLQFNAHADCRDEVCPVIFIFYFLHFTKPSHKHELHIWLHEAVLLHHAVFPFCIVCLCVACFANAAGNDRHCKLLT
jgi:hypothetical protein